MSCPRCGSEAWHSATVCADCGLPYGPGTPKAVTDLQSELAQVRDQLKAELEHRAYMEARYVPLSELEEAQVKIKELEAERDNAVKCLQENFKGVIAIRCMKHFRVPPYNHNEAMGGECPVCEIEDRLDLQNDEFKRIKAISDNEEINGLCDRAVKRITQHTPVIVQRDKALSQLEKAQEKIKELEVSLDHYKRLSEIRCEAGDGSDL